MRTYKYFTKFYVNVHQKQNDNIFYNYIHIEIKNKDFFIIFAFRFFVLKLKNIP